MRATVASLLELPLEAVPHFLAFNGFWWYRVLISFFYTMGWTWIGTGYPYSEEETTPYRIGTKKYYSGAREQTPLLEEDSINGFFYAAVPSANFSNVGHAVVMDTRGYCVHDPSPGKYWQDANILKSNRVTDWMLFEPREKEEPDWKKYCR